MQQPRPAPRLKVALEQIGAWVLDQPWPTPLVGQCCDRLRPAQIEHELLRSLRRHGLERCSLVDWRWNAPRGNVEGWLWQNGLLQRFRWWRADDQLRLRDQLRCHAVTPMRAL